MIIKLFLVFTAVLLPILATRESFFSNPDREKGADNTTEFCDLPSDSGNCYAIFPRYYYDKSSHTCKTFQYGGCGGNSNRFMTLNDCEEQKEKCLVTMIHHRSAAIATKAYFQSMSLISVGIAIEYYLM